MSRNLQVQHVEVASPKAPREIDGLRIAHMSDLHFRGRVRTIERRLAEALEAHPADLLVFTGDTVNHFRSWPEVLAWWKGVDAPSPRYAVPGNWDYVRGGSREVFTRHLSVMGFHTLCNASALYERDGVTMQVVGVDDATRGDPDLERACEGVREDRFTLMLSHSPDILCGWDAPRFDLLLCGHTHGGQIRLPGLGPIFIHTRMGKSFVDGLHELPGGRFVYVSRGIGMGRVNVRINCPPELTILTLRCGG